MAELGEDDPQPYIPGRRFVPPYLPQGQEERGVIAPAPRSGDYPQTDEYGHIPEHGPALTPLSPPPNERDAGGSIFNKLLGIGTAHADSLPPAPPGFEPITRPGTPPPPPGFQPITPPGSASPEGLLTKGNIDLNARPIVKNPDGTISTVRSMSFNADGQEILIPTVAADGSRILTDQEAIDQFRQTGQFLGKFDTPEHATAYAQRLHQQQAQQYAQPPSFLSRMWQGIMDPVYGGAQIGARMGEQTDTGFGPELPPGSSQKQDVITQQREQQYQSQPGMSKLGMDWARLAGNIVSPVSIAEGMVVPGGVGAGLGTKLATGAVGGALGALSSPVTEGTDFWSQKEKQLGLGAAAGGTLGAAAGALAPRMAPDAAKLVQGGMEPGEMTAGQLAGPFSRRFEEAGLKNFPILSYFVRGAEGRSLDSFQRATINQALEPVGASLPKNTQLGNAAIKTAGNAISKAYDDVLSRVPSVASDPELTKGINDIVASTAKNPDVLRKLKPITDDILGQFANSGRLTGRDVKQLDSELARAARGYTRSEDFDKRELGHTLIELRAMLSDAIGRQYPAELPNIKNANASWALLTRIEQAAGRRAAANGRFTPSDLLNAVRSQAGGVRRRDFARGDALFQDWAQTAQRVLPANVPESGTLERALTSGALIEGAGALAHRPIEATAALAGLGAGSLPYTSMGQQAVGRLFMPPGPVRQSIGLGVQGATPGLTGNAVRKKRRTDEKP